MFKLIQGLEYEQLYFYAWDFAMLRFVFFIFIRLTESQMRFPEATIMLCELLSFAIYLGSFLGCYYSILLTIVRMQKLRYS